MTDAIQVTEWNEAHPAGTRVRWVDDGKVGAGTTVGPARLARKLPTAFVLVNPDLAAQDAVLIDIDELSTMPKINTMNEFLVGTQNGRTNIIGGASAQRMDKD